MRNLISTLLLLASVAPLARSGTTVLTGVRVVPMDTDRILEEMTVVVTDDRITAVGDWYDVDFPDDAEVVELPGFYVMPGLIDLHVHPEDQVELELYVVNGVTTVRELAGWEWHLDLRARIEAGDVLGPSLFTSGETIVNVDDLEVARRIVREHARDGYDFLKLYDGISSEAYRAFVEAARGTSVRPCGHIPRNLTLDDVLVAPPASIDHAEEFLYGEFLPALDPATVPAVAEKVRTAGCAVVATLIAYDLIGRQAASLAAAFDGADVRYASALDRRDWGPDRNHYHSFSEESVPRLRRRLQFQRRFLKAFHDAGVPVLLGTDSGGNGVPFVVAGSSAHEELALLASCGLTPYEALAAGTREAARFLGVLGDRGTVEPGKRADLVVVKGNPLEDIDNVRLIAGVFARGRWLDESDLRRRLDRIAAQSIREEAVLRFVASGDLDALGRLVDEHFAGGDQTPPFRQFTLTELAYEKLKFDDDPAAAVALLRQNARVYPNEWNVHDSLGEALRALGDRPAAIRAYERSVQLRPHHREGVRALEELRADSADD